MEEIAKLVINEKLIEKKNEDKLHELNIILQNPEKEHIKNFIDNITFRQSIIEAISQNDIKLISGFLELFSKAIDETWRRALPNGAFYAYNENLILLLDIIENIELSKLPPALLEAIAYNLDHVAHYVGTAKGESRAAYNTWTKRKSNFPKDTKIELDNIGKVRNYYSLKGLWKK